MERTTDENIAELKKLAEKLVGLCEKPETGLHTWWGFVADITAKIGVWKP